MTNSRQKGKRGEREWARYLAGLGFGVSVLMRRNRWAAAADGPEGNFQAFNGESRFAALCQVARQIALKGAGK